MHVYCINLERRPDRRRQVEEEFRREELDSVEFFAATDGCSHPLMNKGECGCTDSHIRLWRDIVDKGYPWALVFEDDARLVEHFRDRLDDILSDLPDDWDYVNLGSVPFLKIKRETVTPRLVRGSSTTTHCYLVSQKGARHLSQWNTRDTHFIVDMQLARTPLSMFYTVQPLATQSVSGWPILGFLWSCIDGDLGPFRKSFDVDFGLRVHSNFLFVLVVCILILKFGLRF
jgi:GR25 family glycosyltransferase involved in LPS biosynthesis